MWYQKSAETAIKELRTNASSGLTHEEIVKRQTKYGQNILPVKKKPPLFFKFLAQFRNYLVVILLLATFISFFLGDILDAGVILTIVIINATIGFIQEIKAEKTLSSLQEKEVLWALVLREGGIEKINSENLVPGDIVILEEGSRIPADARIIESYSLRVDESLLTGESAPVSKNAKPLPLEKVSLADRTNIVYKDTKVMAGRGKVAVVTIGSDTEIGKIALFLKEISPAKTSLTIELEKVGHNLTLIIFVIAAIIFVLNYAAQISFIESLLVSISLSVAAIPEGLPAIVTIVLSLGVKHLAEKKTLVKKLEACETLGAVRIIATDKTGTLTQNKINVVGIILADGKKFHVEGEGYNLTGEFYNHQHQIINPLANPPLETMLKAGVLASNATITNPKSDLQIIGDTTEAALIAAAFRAGIVADEIKKAEERIYEVPFSSERKMMSVIVKINSTGDHILYAKGAPEVIVEKCQITNEQKRGILATTKTLAQNGLRSLVFAKKNLTNHEVKKTLEEDQLEESGFTYMGIASMQDPLRPEVKEVLRSAKLAGIRTIMITGDHKETAASIARQAGIMKKGDKILTDEDIDNMSTAELSRQIKNGTSVFARISPMGKLKIVQAIKRIPQTQVAVTGDGVNDAPALSAADIAIAMGKSGTDLTRDIADIVIMDDNYATIIDAIRGGRVIFANLVKFIRYLISCNLSEVLVVSLGVLFATPLPLIPIQILWINLITDGLPALALGVDPAEFDVMKKPPRDMTEGILHKKRWFYMAIEGSIMGVSVFLLFLFSLSNFSLTIAQTITFTALGFSQLIHAFNNRSTRKSLFEIGLFGNKVLIGAAILSVILQILVVQTNLGNLIFKTEKLEINHWFLIAFIAILPFFVVEIKKQLRFRILP